MSDIAPGSFSLEENALSETPPDAPDTPAASAEAPPPATHEDAEPEGTIVNPGGEKLVPLGALAGAREKARQANEAKAALEAENAQLREKAGRLDQIKGEWDAVQPLIQQVRNGTYQPPKPPEKPAGPLSETEAIEYAKDLDLYKTDGTPDIARAQRLAARQEALAEKQAQRYVQPLQQQSAQQQSIANFHAVSQMRLPDGSMIDQGVLREVWSMMPIELTAQTGIANVMQSIAIGQTVLRGKHKTPTAPPPPAQITESLGGQSGRPELSAFERNFIATTDMKPKEYEEISGRYKPGERNSLE